MSLASRMCGPFLVSIPKRCLHLQEYQSKTLLSQYQIATQRFRVGTTSDEILEAAKQLKSSRIIPSSNDSNLPHNIEKFTWVLKAQILAGGRGKGFFKPSGFKGGVHLTENIGDIPKMASLMLHQNLVTQQTPPEGVPVKKLLIAEAVQIQKETYFAILLDRKSRSPIILASPLGGMDIEAVAHQFPDKILTEKIDVMEGISAAQFENIANFLDFDPKYKDQVITQIDRLYNLFINNDCLQVEVNPFALTSDGQVICVDAKIQLDENAAFRHHELYSSSQAASADEQDIRELEASKHSLNYIGLHGDIGCLVNGAGLAMATMDMIHHCGGSPANFLDVGGNANKSQVKEAFKLLSSDPNIKAILINIFGGIMRCDIIAQGIIDAVQEISLSLPLIVRLSGTNNHIAMDLLRNSKLPILIADDMESAAQLAVKAASANSQTS